jgi:hypothetical protein
MKVKKLVLLCIVAIVLNSCNVDKCDVDCNSGPLSLYFELLDKTTGENLFTNGTFDPADIEVLDLDNNNSSVQYTFESENDRNTINLGPFGWGTNIANYLLKVGEGDIFTLNVDAEQKTEDCCSYIRVNKLEITGATYEQNQETGIYEVLVEL